MVPKITVAEAKRALRTLLELGFLVEDESGSLVQADEVVSTGPEMQHVHIARYHMMMMERAVASIDLVAPEQRDISAITLLVGPDGLERLKRRMQRFRRELIQLSLLDKRGAQVVQMNFQMFPLSTDAKRTKR